MFPSTAVQQVHIETIFIFVGTLVVGTREGCIVLVDVREHVYVNFHIYIYIYIFLCCSFVLGRPENIVLSWGAVVIAAGGWVICALWQTAT